MTISSRTPEGDPNQCPICGHRLRLELSIDTRDAPCPSCGHLLWFAVPKVERSTRTVQQLRSELDQSHSEFKELAIKFATKRFGPPGDAVRATIGELPADKFVHMPWKTAISARSWDEFLELMSSAKD